MCHSSPSITLFPYNLAHILFDVRHVLGLLIRSMSKDTSMNVKSVNMPFANDVTFVYGMSLMVSHLEKTIVICKIGYT